ncbi:MAG: hypothetical protein AB7H77_04265 [Bdellovibrionales bacterium]
MIKQIDCLGVQKIRGVEVAIIDKIISQYGGDGFEKAISVMGRETVSHYADRVYNAYCDEFKDADYLKNIEWLLRQYQASKKILLSAMFFTQAEELINNKMQNLSFYALYYALFNALAANIILHPHIHIDKTKKISHAQVFDDIDNYFVRFSIFSDPRIVDLLNDLRLMRELYSYHLPLSGSLDVDDDRLNIDKLFSRLQSSLPVVLQVANLLSFSSYFAWEKKIGKAIDEYSTHRNTVDDMFFSYIEVWDHLKTQPVMDGGDYSQQGYMLAKIGIPWPISWFLSEKMCEELECGWGDGEDSLPHEYDIASVSRYLTDVMG